MAGRKHNDVEAETFDTAHRLSDHFKPYAAQARERVEPAMQAAIDRVGPAVSSARDRVEPALLTAREAVGPAMESARERLNEDVVPKVAAAVATAAESLSKRAAEVHDRAAEFSAPPPSHRGRKVLLFTLALAGGAAIAVAVASRRRQVDNWQEFEAQARQWAEDKTHKVEDNVSAAAQKVSDKVSSAADSAKSSLKDVADKASRKAEQATDEVTEAAEAAADDVAGAAPDEALADKSEHPTAPTTPDEPTEEVDVAKPKRTRKSTN